MIPKRGQTGQQKKIFSRIQKPLRKMDLFQQHAKSKKNLKKNQISINY